jgi:hypothetical protein
MVPDKRDMVTKREPGARHRLSRFAQVPYHCPSTRDEAHADDGTPCTALEIRMIKLTARYGDILVELDAEKAPETCADFEQCVLAGHQDVPIQDLIIEQACVVE